MLNVTAKYNLQGLCAPLPRGENWWGKCEYLSGLPQNSHPGDNFCEFLVLILDVFYKKAKDVFQKRCLEGQFFLAVLQKANSLPVPQAGRAPALVTLQGPLRGCRWQEKQQQHLREDWKLSRGYPHLSHTPWIKFFKTLAPEVRRGVLQLLLWAQLLSKLRNCAAGLIFTSLTFFGCLVIPPCHSCGVCLAGFILVPPWVHWGWAGHRAPGSQPKSFPSQNPSLPGAGSWVLGQGKVWSWILSGQEEGFDRWGLPKPFCC